MLCYPKEDQNALGVSLEKLLNRLFLMLFNHEELRCELVSCNPHHHSLRIERDELVPILNLDIELKALALRQMVLMPAEENSRQAPVLQLIVRAINRHGSK